MSKEYEIIITRKFVPMNRWDLLRLHFFIEDFRADVIKKLKADGKWIEHTPRHKPAPQQLP